MRFLALAAALVLGGCPDAALPDGRALCAKGPQPCPGGYYCASDSTCWQDGHAPDLASATGATDSGADLAAPSCRGLFCDDFEADVIGTGAITAGGAARWQLNGVMAPNSVVDIDGSGGALGSARALRFSMFGAMSGGMFDPTYQRYSTAALLSSSVMGYVRILTGPTYARFFVKLSDQRTASLAFINFDAGAPGEFEIRAQPDGVDFELRYNFTSMTATRTPVVVSWTGDWVCVEWSNSFVAGDGGLQFHSTVSINGAAAATFDGAGTPGVMEELLIGADEEFRSDVPNFTMYKQWFDEVVFSDRPIRVPLMRLVSALLALALIVAPAHADEDKDKLLHDYVRAGNGFYSIGDYEQALRQYAAGYERTAHPAFLVNIGQCYRKLDDCVRACAAFHRWQSESRRDDALRAQVATLIEALQCDAPQTPREPAPATAPTTAPTIVATTPPPRPRPALRNAGIALVTIGGVGLALGATFIGLAVQANQTVANPPAGWVYDPGLDSRRAVFFPAGLTLGVVGAASLVSGAVLLKKGLWR